VKYTFFIIWILGVELSSLAQVVDTIKLSQSIIPLFKQTETLDSALINNQLSSVVSILKDNSSIQFQEYGARGSIQSVLIRGLTANHTKVKWNSLQINSLALGMFDFGGISSFGNNYLKLNKGANVENDGDGAIGGSINFGSNHKFNLGTTVKYDLLTASFETYSLGVVSSVSKKRWLYSIAFNKEMANNNFEYKNYKRIGNPLIRQSNSEFRSTNLIQEIGFKFKKIQFKSVSWWNGKRKNIPLLLTENQENNKFIADSAFRSVLSLKTHVGKVIFSGFIGRDKQWFKYVNPGIVSSYYIVANDQGELKIKSQFKNIKWNLKSNFQIQNAQNTNYLGLKQRILNFNSINVRGEIKKVAFKATVGIQNSSDLTNVNPTSVVSYAKKYKYFEVKGGIGTHFRQPTFNDLFWKTGGNSKLLAEKGWSLEQFVTLQKKKIGSINFGGYYSIVEDWIQWVPSESVWRPQNVKKIKASGIESTIKFNKRLGNVKSAFFNSSSFTRTTVLKSNLVDDIAIGNQAVNIPFFNSTNTVQVNWNYWRIKYYLAYKGKRYISFDNNEASALPSYWLSSFGITKLKKLKSLHVTICTRITNLLNKSYEIVGNTPMPGRAYYLTLKFKFKTKEIT
jgi:iron complex outermembrane receptor protein